MYCMKPSFGNYLTVQLYADLSWPFGTRSRTTRVSPGLAGGQAGQYALVQVDQRRNVYRGYTISSKDPTVEPLEVTVKLDKKGGICPFGRV